MQVQRQRLTGLVALRGDDAGVLGHLMAASGRLCFAVPTQGQTRIGELLAAGDPEAERHIESAVTEARERKLRICEVLLERDTLPLERLRGALRGQTARALALMAETAGGRLGGVDVHPSRDDYDRRLTFSALDIFVTASAALDSLPQDRASLLFHEFEASCDAALLLTRAGDPASLPLPVAARGLEETSLEDVVTIARAAAEMSRPSPLFGNAEPSRISVFRARDSAWFCATSEQRVAVLRTGPQSEAGQILGYALRLVRSSFPEEPH